MRKERRHLVEEKQQVPGYIVTFSDMVTLLLTFFVLLLTLAQVQDPELFDRGRDSFWESIHFCGLGSLLGGNVTANFGETKTRYETSDPEDSSSRTIDERRNKLKQIFQRLNQSMTTLPTQLQGQHLDFQVTDVRFAPGETTLSDSSKRFLSGYCLNLLQNLDPRSSTLYVLGLADSDSGEADQWTLSSRRAQAVAQSMEESLNRKVAASRNDPPAVTGPTWRVLWWGTGPGGAWGGQETGQSQILIAVLKSNEYRIGARSLSRSIREWKSQAGDRADRFNSVKFLDTTTILQSLLRREPCPLKQ